MGVTPTREIQIQRLPISDPLKIPNFNDDDRSRGFQGDELLEHLSFKVANLANYNENENTLLEHINQGSSELFFEFLIPQRAFGSQSIVFSSEFFV